MTKVAAEAVEHYLAEHGFAADNSPDDEDRFAVTARGRAALGRVPRAA